jgi:hypothetical protein
MCFIIIIFIFIFILMFQSNTTAETETEVEEGVEEEEETPLTLEGLLEKVGLKEKVSVFHQEQIDLESLVRMI